MVLKILGRKSSSNVQKVLVCCDELQVPYEREDIGGEFGRNNEAPYLALNPNGVVPTLDVEFAKDLGSVIVMVDLVIGWTAIQSMANWCRKNDMLLHMHRAGHGTYTRQKNHGVSFRVIAKWLRLAGCDHLHAGTAVGKLEGDPMTVQGYYNVCRDSYTKQDLPRGLFFDQDWADLKKVMPVASGGIPTVMQPPTRRVKGASRTRTWRRERASEEMNWINPGANMTTPGLHEAAPQP